MSGNLRFLATVGFAALVFVILGGAFFLSSSYADGGFGLALSIAGLGSFGLGLLLAYRVSIDWLNLRVVRRSLGNTNAPQDGDVVAFSGVVRVEGEPMISPMSGIPCAAHSYVVSVSRTSTQRNRSTRQVCAQGFHMLPTRIVGSWRTLALRSFPGFEDELRESTMNGTWEAEARELVERIADSAPSAGQREREALLLEARHSVIQEVHQDFHLGGVGNSRLKIEQEVLPVGEEVCVVGTYDTAHSALTARRARLGANLMIYKGSAEEVSLRVGKESAVFTKVAIVLVAVGLLLLAHPLLLGSPLIDAWD